MNLKQVQFDTVASIKARQDHAQGILAQADDFRLHLMTQDMIHRFLDEITSDIRASSAIGSNSVDFIVIQHAYASFSRIRDNVRIFCLGISLERHDRFSYSNFGQRRSAEIVMQDFFDEIRREFPDKDGWKVEVMERDLPEAESILPVTDDRKAIQKVLGMTISWMEHDTLMRVVKTDLQDIHLKAIEQGVPVEDVFAVATEMPQDSARYVTCPD